MLLGLDPSGAINAEFSYGSFDGFMAGALFGAWTSDVLKNGITVTSFSYEEMIEQGGTDAYSRFSGCMVNPWSLSLGSRDVVTCTFNLMGRKEELATVIVAGSTYTPPNTNPISTATANVAELTVTGVNPPPKVKSLKIDIANNLRIRDKVRDLYTEEFGRNRRDITVEMQCYFESIALYQAFLDHGNGTLSFKVGNAAGERYLVELPKIIFASGKKTTGGNNDDVMVTITARAVYDEVEECSIKITRAVA